MRICFYTMGKPYRQGTFPAKLASALVARGVEVAYGDENFEPDLYIFEKVWYPTRYPKKPVIIRANTILDRWHYKNLCWNKGDAIVYESKWLQDLYQGTYGDLPLREVVIPVSDDASRRPFPNNVAAPHVVCMAKWWKRPFKRFPLIYAAFRYLQQIGYPQASLHVVGWLLDRKMPYVESFPRIVRLPRGWKETPNVHFYQKSFHDDTKDHVLEKAHLLVHLSAIDSGPQVVMEALCRGIPVLVSNNMGAAGWLANIGPKAGLCIPMDRVTSSYRDVRRMKLMRRKTCSWVAPYKEVAWGMKSILDQYSDFEFDLPYGYTMDGICDQWLRLFKEVLSQP